MFVYCSIDPEIFTNSYISDVNIRNNLEFFLKSIKDNNVIIAIDPGGEIEKHLTDNISALSTKLGQQLQIIYSELLKVKRYKLIKIYNKNFTYPSIAYLSIDIVKMLYLICQLDGIVTTHKTASKLLAEKFCKYENLIDTKAILACYFEKLRARLLIDQSLDLMHEKDVEERFIRLLKFTSWIRLYDKQLGKGENIEGFYEGFNYILEVYKKYGMHIDPLKTTIEIFTCIAEPIYPNETETIRFRKKSVADLKLDEIKKNIINPLSKKYQLPIKIHFKNDVDNIFHARFLETENSNILFERGFDLFKKNGELRRNFLKIFNTSSHLSECRALDDYQNL